MELPESSMSSDDCSSPTDLVTLEEWEKSPPDVKIIFKNPGFKDTVHCYRSESLRQWLTDPNIPLLFGLRN